MKRILLLSFLLILCFPIFVLATPEKPAIGVSDPYPVIGEKVQLMVSHSTFPLEQFKLEVTYRPNSKVMKKVNLGSPNDNGILEWIPEDAGVTVLTAIANQGTEAEIKIEKNISVRFGYFPPLGIFIFLLAAITLFGGLFLTISKMGKAPATIQ